MFDCPEFYEFLTQFCAIFIVLCAIFSVLCAIKNNYFLTFLFPHPTTCAELVEVKRPAHLLSKQTFTVIIKPVRAMMIATIHFRVKLREEGLGLRDFEPP